MQNASSSSHAAMQERYRWRPISEIHEDYGDVVLVNVFKDTGCLKLGSNLDIDESECWWNTSA